MLKLWSVHTLEYINCFKGSTIYILLLLSIHSLTLASGGESDVPACGPPASFSVQLACSAVTPAGSVHKSGVTMWCVYGCSEEMMCVVCVDVTEGV